jgi:nucleotide-binding universal stress UspA family protein
MRMPAAIYNNKFPNESMIVPLDGSKLAEIALPYAEELGVRTGSNITLLSVLEFADTVDMAYLRRIIDVTKYHAKKYLLIPGTKEVDISATTCVGNPAGAIVDFACKWGHKLIVMATHGRSGIGRWAVGSVADKVVRSPTNVPVMLIRGKKARPDVRQKRLLRKALVPLDGSISSQAVIPYISQLALKLEMQLTLLQVVQQTNNHKADAESYLQTRCAELEQQGIAANYRVQVGSPANEIINLADELAIDLVAMSTRGRTSIPLWTLGSVAQKVLLGGSTPLLLVRHK